MGRSRAGRGTQTAGEGWTQVTRNADKACGRCPLARPVSWADACSRWHDTMGSKAALGEQLRSS